MADRSPARLSGRCGPTLQTGRGSAFQQVSTSAFQRVSLRGKERTPVVLALPRCGCLRNRRTLDLSYSVVSLPGVGQGCTTERAGCGTLPMAGWNPLPGPPPCKGGGKVGG